MALRADLIALGDCIARFDLERFGFNRDGGRRSTVGGLDVHAAISAIRADLTDYAGERGGLGSFVLIKEILWYPLPAPFVVDPFGRNPKSDRHGQQDEPQQRVPRPLSLVPFERHGY